MKVTTVNTDNIAKLDGVDLANVSKYITEEISAEVVLQNLATASGFSGTIEMWLTGSGTKTVQWKSLDTEQVALSATPTKVSQTFDNEDAAIAIGNHSGLTGIIISVTKEDDFSPDLTISTSNINNFQSLQSFFNLGGIISGAISSINISSLVELNLGEQVGNTALTGDLGVLFSNHSFDLFYLDGGNCSVTDQDYQTISGDFFYTFHNTGLSDSEVDQLLIDFSAAHTVNEDARISITGFLNGLRTSASDAAFTDLDGDGVVLELNAIPIEGFTYSNSDQVFEVSTAATTLTPSFTNSPGSNVEFSSWGLPSWLSLNSSTGVLTANGSPSTEGRDTFVIRAVGFSTHSGYEDVYFDIIVNYSTAATLSNPIDTASGGDSAIASVDINQDIGTVYVVLTDSITAPDETEIMNGEDETGTSVGSLADSTEISASGTITFNFTGLLSPGQTKYAHFVHAAGNYTSNIASGDGLSTQNDPEEEIFIDFGSQYSHASGNWNNIDNLDNSPGTVISDLAAFSDGSGTGIDMEIDTAWDGTYDSTSQGYNGSITDGVTTIPAAATRDCFYSVNPETIIIDVSGYTDWASKIFNIKGGGYRSATNEDQCRGEVTDGVQTDQWSCSWNDMGGADLSDPDQNILLADVAVDGSGLIQLDFSEAAVGTPAYYALSWLKIEIVPT